MTDDLYNELVTIRHYIHRHPELSGEEFGTSAYIREVLERQAISACPSPLETGLVIEIGSKEKGPVIALRADIDALPVEEKTGLPYSSETQGLMHACGHDFHLTALIGAAYELKKREEELPGLVRLIFQPGEESTWGSKQVVAAGHLDDVAVIVGFHNNPAYPVGTVALKDGAIMAGVDQFRVEIKGKGSHAAQPHLGIDVVTTLSSLIQQLQTIVSRNMNPREAAVLSITHIQAGETWNVLPDSGFFEGTTRSFSEETRILIKQRFFDIVRAAEEAYGVRTTVSWSRGPDITYNDPQFTAEVARACAHFANVVQATPSNGGEDFATYLEKVPGVFAFVGTNGEPNAPGWHHSNFIVKDEALPVAVDYYVQTAVHLLDYLNVGKWPDVSGGVQSVGLL